MTAFSFHAADTEEAFQAVRKLKKIYNHAEPDVADAIIALGGDGFLLETLHKTHGFNKPVFGMNLGTEGFLMNTFSPDNLAERVKKAQRVSIHPLRMTARCSDGHSESALAFNEVAIFRETRQAAKIRVLVDKTERIRTLVGDGIMLATPMGSTAYNLSAHGPILPLNANVHALTPISPFRPRRWQGALLPESATVRFETLEASKRPVSATADFTEVRDVISVDIEEDRHTTVTLMFDQGMTLEDRILREQFPA